MGASSPRFASSRAAALQWVAMACVFVVAAAVVAATVAVAATIAQPSTATPTRTYEGAPTLSWTFDTDPTDLPKSEGSSFTWFPSLAGSGGVMLFNGAGDFLNLSTFSDDSDVLVTSVELGGALSFETRVMYLRFTWYGRVFDIAHAPPTGGLADNNLALSTDRDTSTLAFTAYHGSDYDFLLSPGAITLGEWVDVVITLAPTSPTTATQTMYVNGAPAAPISGYSAIQMLRNSAYIGRSNFAQDGPFYGFLDSFSIYQEALDAEAVAVHHVLPRAPAFELTLGVDPRINMNLTPTTAQYGWATGGSAGEPVGQLTFDGRSHYVDLASTKSPASIGYVMPSFGGVGRAAADAASSAGWTLEVTFRLSSLPSPKLVTGSIFAFASEGGADGVSLSVSSEGALVFSTSNSRSGRSSVVTSTAGVVVQNAWMHVVVVVQQPQVATQGGAPFTVFVNGVAVSSFGSSSTVAWIDRVERSGVAQLGGAGFAGAIDNFRVYDYRMSASVVQAVHGVVASAIRGSADEGSPRPVVAKN